VCVESEIQVLKVPFCLLPRSVSPAALSASHLRTDLEDSCHTLFRIYASH